MVPPAGIEPAAPGLGNQYRGLYKRLKIPIKYLMVKDFNMVSAYM